MGNDSGDFLLGDAVVLGIGEVILQGRIGNAHGHERDNSNNAAGLQIDVLIVPVLSKENIIIVVGKIRSKGAEGISSCCLYYLFGFVHCCCLRGN